MAVKVYGYAESEADVYALRAYAVMDIILEDMAERGQYQILRRFLREGDTLIVAHWSALGDSAAAIGYPKGWKRIFGRYQAKEIRALEASNELKISRATFYRLAKRYRQG